MATHVAAVTAVEEAEAKLESAAEACVIPKTVAFVAPVLINDPIAVTAERPLEESTLTAVGATVNAVRAVPVVAVCAEAAINPDEDITLAAVGVAVNAVTAKSAAFALLAVANTGALVGAAENAVMPVDVEAVNADAPVSAIEVPLAATNPEKNCIAPENALSATAVVALKAENVFNPNTLTAPTMEGDAEKAVKVELAVANDDAAESDPEAMLVTAEAVRLELALAPKTEIDHEVDSAAHDIRWAMAYSPAERDEAANVKG